jgi:hypothetical protein
MPDIALVCDQGEKTKGAIMVIWHHIAPLDQSLRQLGVWPDLDTEP